MQSREKEKEKKMTRHFANLTKNVNRKDGANIDKYAKPGKRKRKENEGILPTYNYRTFS